MIQSSATGGKEAPEFPDLSNLYDDILSPEWHGIKRLSGIVSGGTLR